MINQLLTDIIESYPIESKKKFANNDVLHNTFQEIVAEIEKLLKGLKIENYKTDFSYGKGNWASVPWIAILNTEKTKSVSKGVYIVLLFSTDKNSVYLTLNQGTGGIDRAKFNTSHTENAGLYKNMISNNAGFLFGPMDEGALDSKKRPRPKAYEQACIYSKKYTVNDLKNQSDNMLLEDLKILIGAYFEDRIIKKNDVKLGRTKSFDIKEFNSSLKAGGLIFDEILVTRFIASLLTKPFVILTGLSGSGKTRLAQAFVQWICSDKTQYCIIPVGADWTNREPLLGFPNALDSKLYVTPDNGVLDLIIRAEKNTSVPYFLVLDEMNLSHVERYFADFLSVMESDETIPLYAEGTEKKGAPPNLPFPANLFIIGTVNIDETTNMFSPKVLDRANTIEFRVTKKEMEAFLNMSKDIDMNEIRTKGESMSKSFLEISRNKFTTPDDIQIIKETLVNFFGELKKTGAEFGYRSASEILHLINQLTIQDSKLKTNDKLDIAIMQKLLPKLHGSRRKLCPVLETLGSLCLFEDKKIIKDIFKNEDFDFYNSNVKYPLSLEKITRMYNGAIDNGFASYAEA